MNKSEQLKFQFQTDLFEKICGLETLREAFKAVKRNKGAPGIDGITIEKYEENLEENLKQLKIEVLSWKVSVKYSHLYPHNPFCYFPLKFH